MRSTFAEDAKAFPLVADSKGLLSPTRGEAETAGRWVSTEAELSRQTAQWSGTEAKQGHGSVCNSPWNFHRVERGEGQDLTPGNANKKPHTGDVNVPGSKKGSSLRTLGDISVLTTLLVEALREGEAHRQVFLGPQPLQPSS